MFRAVSLVGILSLASVTIASAQPTEPTTHTSFPRVIRIAGTLPRSVGAPSPIATITFAIYSEETGGTPLWQETQTVIVDGAGAYNALLGRRCRTGYRWRSSRHTTRGGSASTSKARMSPINRAC